MAIVSDYEDVMNSVISFLRFGEWLRQDFLAEVMNQESELQSR